MLKIVKLENGVVKIVGGSVYVNRSFSSFARVNYKKGGIFEIDELGRIVASFKGSEVASTQVLPAAAVDYTDDNTLLATLQNDFFFSVSGGSTVTTEQAQTVIENFNSLYTGQTLGFTADFQGDDLSHFNAAVTTNLDGATTATRMGAWNMAVLGNALDYFILKSVQADFTLETDNQFKHTWDLAFVGGNTLPSADEVFHAVGYCTSADTTNGNGGILNGFYIRPTYRTDTPRNFYLCVAIAGVEVLKVDTGVLYTPNWGRFGLEWDGVNDKVVATIADGSQTVTLEIVDFLVTYPTLAATELNKVLWVECGATITTVTSRAIIYDRHTEYVKSNY